MRSWPTFHIKMYLTLLDAVLYSESSPKTTKFCFAPFWPNNLSAVHEAKLHFSQKFIIQRKLELHNAPQECYFIYLGNKYKYFIF